MIYGLILAGGKGSRLYPLSRSNEPKQFLKIINEKSFLVNTVNRVTSLIDRENIYVVTNEDYKDKISYFELTTDFSSSDVMLRRYVKHIFEHAMKTK